MLWAVTLLAMQRLNKRVGASSLVPRYCTRQHSYGQTSSRSSPRAAGPAPSVQLLGSAAHTFSAYHSTPETRHRLQQHVTKPHHGIRRTSILSGVSLMHARGRPGLAWDSYCRSSSGSHPQLTHYLNLCTAGGAIRPKMCGAAPPSTHSFIGTVTSRRSSYYS